MMDYFTHRIDRIAVRSALGCFLFGTVLFLTLLTGQLNIIEGLAIAFLIFAVGANTILVLIVAVTCLVYPKEVEQHISAMVLMLLNYPIARFYIQFLF
ncbi:MAG: hypothetical protein WBG48_15665 [Pricia sp.]